MPFADHLWGLLRAHAAPTLTRLGIVLVIILAALLAARLLAILSERALRRTSGQAFAPLVRGLVTVVVFGAGLITALDRLGLNVSAVLASAGVLGLALSLGAQAVVRDVISGFFLVLDDVLAPGDRVVVGDVVGEVEGIGLRMTRVRSFNGQLWYLPNGEIKTVGNASRGWSRAVVDVGIAPEVDWQRGLSVLHDAGERFVKAHPGRVLAPAEAMGPTLHGGEIGLRLAVKVTPQDQLGAERDLRLYVKEAFVAAGLELRRAPT